MTDPFDPANPDYQRFLADCEKDCRCCPDCSDVPCAGVMAGGLCDEMCHCQDDEYDDPAGGDDGYDSDYEDQP